jgi:hypothetical protein
MKRALLADLSALEALQNGLDQPLRAHALGTGAPLVSTAEAEHILDTLGTFLTDVRPHFVDCDVNPATAAEIWIAYDFSDVLGSITGRRAGLSEADFSGAVAAIANAIKRTLLFAHRVVLNDELLPSLKDRLSPVEGLSAPAEAREARVRFALAVYAELAPLLRDEVVLLVEHRDDQEVDGDDPQGAFRLDVARTSDLARRSAEAFRTRWPSSPLVRADREFGGGGVFSHATNGGGRINLNDQKDIEFLGRLMIQSLVPMRLLQPRLDPCFTSLEVARLYGQILSEVKEGWTRYELDRPLIMTELATNAGIRPEALSVAEAAAIRRDEEIFADWRGLIRDVVSEIVAEPRSDAAREAVLKASVREREAEWRARFKEKISGGGVLRDLIDPRQSILTGVCAAGIFSIATGGVSLAAAAVAAGSEVARDVLIYALEAAGKRDRRAAGRALRSHFMAVGAQV